MCETVAEARAHVLALLLRGYSPEEVEEMVTDASLHGDPCVMPPTALSDPNNLLMVEVPDDTGA
jgi:hypothetical protein